jgi:DNA recombination protein RmuC
LKFAGKLTAERRIFGEEKLMGEAMLDVILGICIGIAGLFALLFGIRIGKGSAKAECQAMLDRIAASESEKLRLNGLVAEGNERIQQLREQLARLEERESAQKEKYALMKSELDSAFADLASKALRENNQSFLLLAQEKLGAQSNEAKQALNEKETAIKNLLDPLGIALGNLDTQTREMEIRRSGAYAEVKTLVENIQNTLPASLDALKNETSQLITALRAPKTRGNWGELQLKRCVEYAGMVEYCSFAEQTSTRTEDDRLLRPDMTVQLPNGRTIIVDAKTPLDAFLDAGNSSDPSAQTLRFAAHAKRVKSHLQDLSSKSYWKQFDHTPEFVVCFMPSEALFSAALEADPSLIEFSSNANVVMATPTTLIALLKAVAYGWQQSQVAENAKKIQDAGRDLYNKIVNAHEYFSKLGSALEGAIGNYNKFVGAVEGRGGAFFHARKLAGLVHIDEIEPLEALPAEPRSLTAEDWAPTSELALAASADVTPEP